MLAGLVLCPKKRGVANDPVLGCFGYQIGQKITLYNTRIKRSLI